MNDTIAALSSAPGPSMRAVVRVSGPAAFELAARIVAEGPDPSNLPGFSAPVVNLRLHKESRLPARMLIMRGPRSYTTEDVVEFHILGAQSLAESLLAVCIDEGARPAGPGEFTQRAFLGGRIDAAQVEGVLNLIESRSDGERRAAMHLLQGRISKEVHHVRAALIDALAAIEAYLDFTDEDTEALDYETVRQRLFLCRKDLQHIVETMGRKETWRGLPSVVLLGPQNAGKSTLFNVLVPASRVIMSEIPGTTRDLLEGEVTQGVRPFLLFDAPGVVQSRDPLERLALSRLSGRMAQMDAVLTVFDCSKPPDPENIPRIQELAGIRPCRYILNKSDLAAHRSWDDFNLDEPLIRVSARTGEGLSDLVQVMDRFLPSVTYDNRGGTDIFLMNALQKTCDAINNAIDEDWEGGLELVAMELREATEALGQLGARVLDEEILNQIFSRFCIGK